MIQTRFLQVFILLGGFYLILGLTACDSGSGDTENDLVFTDTLTVTVSAYNSLKAQGEGDPNVTSWGDTLSPGMKSIAVSRDLIRKGLTHGTPVAIEGFDGVFIVNDKMHHRWRNKIDIYMGINRKKAKNWGKKKLKISFPGEQTE